MLIHCIYTYVCGEVFIGSHCATKSYCYRIMHACLPFYSEALSHCSHGHKLTSVVQIAVIRIAGIRCAFIGSASFRTVAEALLTVHQRQASLLVLLTHSPAVWASQEHHCHPQLYLQLLAVSQWIQSKSWAGPLQ